MIHYLFAIGAIYPLVSCLSQASIWYVFHVWDTGTEQRDKIVLDWCDDDDDIVELGERQEIDNIPFSDRRCMDSKTLQGRVILHERDSSFRCWLTTKV